MNRPSKPRLLVLTSSFPSSPSDETCGYVREFAESLSAWFDVTVAAPSDASDDSKYRCFKVERPNSRLNRFSRGNNSAFRATDDLNEVVAQGIVGRLKLAPGLIAFAFKAITLGFSSDVICSHWMVPAGLIGAMCSKALGKRHVVVEHSGGLHLLRKSKARRMLARFIVRRSNTIVVVSEDLKTGLLEFCPEAAPKVNVIPMGLYAQSAEPYIEPLHINALRRSVDEGRDTLGTESDSGTARIDGRRTVLFIGRLVRIKGVDVLIRAAARIRNLRLVIAGDGPERSRLQELASELGVDAEFKGVVTGRDKTDLYRQADAVVIPSITLADGRTEGTPRVCLEAMTRGCPVIASRCGGLPELIVDGQNGFLFEPGDDRMLTRKLEHLMRDSSLALRLGAAGRHTATRYDWSVVGPKFRRLLQDQHESELVLLKATPE